MSILFKEKRINSCEKLLSFVAPENSLFFQNGSGGRWIFRGQSDSSWSLEPSACRSLPVGKDTVELPLLWETERRNIFAFQKRCRELGIQLPEVEDCYLAEYLDGFGTLYRRLPFLALGQHYGMHTRLLDWSYDPMVALYFASSGSESVRDVDCALWAFYLADESSGRPVNYSIQGREYGLFCYQPSSHINKYALAQKALFTVSVHKRLDSLETESMPPSEFLETENGYASDFDIYSLTNDAKFEDPTMSSHGKPQLLKITFSPFTALEVLRALESRFIARHRLFPDIRGVCESIILHPE